MWLFVFGAFVLFIALKVKIGKEGEEV